MEGGTELYKYNISISKNVNMYLVYEVEPERMIAFGESVHNYVDYVISYILLNTIGPKTPRYSVPRKLHKEPKRGISEKDMPKKIHFQWLFEYKRVVPLPSHLRDVFIEAIDTYIEDALDRFLKVLRNELNLELYYSNRN